MIYKTITDRFEAEKLAEDIFICTDKPIICIDYADLRVVKRISVLKYAISINIGCSDEGFIDKLLEIIKASSLPQAELKTCLIHIRANGADQSLTYENVGNLVLKIRESNIGACSDGKCLYAVTDAPSVPVGEWHIDIVFGFNKTEEERLDDEKYEQMIEEYRKSMLPPMPDEFVFPEFPVNNKCSE